MKASAMNQLIQVALKTVHRINKGGLKRYWSTGIMTLL